MMKQQLIELIEAEAARATLGEQAQIQAKLNSLNDVEIMDALQKAAEAGVQIKLNIRGTCCWTPSTPRAQSHVRIVSIVDTYLEHARIISFHHGGAPLVYLASADWMSRNLDRRVELMVPLSKPEHIKRALGILEACFKDNEQSFQLMPDGSYVPVAILQQLAKKNESHHKTGKASKTKKFRMQKHLHQLAHSNARANARARRQMLEPHQAKNPPAKPI